MVGNITPNVKSLRQAQDRLGAFGFSRVTPEVKDFEGRQGILICDLQLTICDLGIEWVLNTGSPPTTLLR
jgi:hypothetical protein